MSKTSEPKILRNAARCRLCGDTVESLSVHHFVRCSCGEIFVDGGFEYLHAGALNFENFEDLSEVEAEVKE